MVFAWGFSHPGNYSVPPAEIRDSNISWNCSMSDSFDAQSRWVHLKYTWSRNDVGSSKSTFFITFFHTSAILCFVPAILMSSTCSDKNNPCLRWTNRHSKFRTFFSIQVPIELLQTVSPTRVPQVSVRTSFFRVEQRGPQCSSRILAKYGVEDVSTSLFLLTLFSCHAEVASSFLQSMSTAAFASRIFMACGIGRNVCTKW